MDSSFSWPRNVIKCAGAEKFEKTVEWTGQCQRYDTASTCIIGYCYFTYLKWDPFGALDLSSKPQVMM